MRAAGTGSCLPFPLGRGKTILLISLLVLAVLSFHTAIAKPTAPSDVTPTLTVSYHGLDKVHFSYESDHDIKITASVAGGDEETIIAYGGSFSGSYSHTGLTPAVSGYNITYRIYKKVKIGEVEQDVLETTVGTEFTNSVTGQLLFDDTFDKQTFVLGTVTVPDGKSFTIKDSVVESYGSITSTGGDVTIEETEFKDCGSQLLLINQSSTSEPNIIVKKSYLFDVNAKGAVNLTENELRDLKLIKRSSSKITTNTFTGTITPWGDNSSGSWVSDWSASGATPDIDNNVFLGMHALRIQSDFPVSPPILLGGSNSFGDIQGPTLRPEWHYSYADLDFLKSRGALVQTGGYTVETYANVLRYPQKIPVDVFALNWIVGQNTISHDGHGNWGTQFEDRRVLLTDRETLLSLDVASTKPAEITIYATVDGVEVYREIHSLQRYYGNYAGPTGTNYTVNIVLPPVSADNPGESADAEVVVGWDSTGVEGWEKNEGQYPLMSTTLTFAPGPSRIFRMGVIPINAAGSCSGRASAGGVLPYITKFFPAMFPVRETEIYVDIRPPLTVNCGVLDYLSPEFLTAEIATMAQLSNNFVTNWWTRTNPFDRYVAVVPASAIGDDIEGGYVSFWEKVILVNERYPSSVLHEMGHSAGIDYEEYSSAQPDGYPVEDSTIFDPTGESTGVTQERYQHMPGTYTVWGANDPPIYDIMSRMSAGVWPRFTTLRYLYDYFKTITDTSAKQTAQENAAPLAAETPSGTRQILLYGKIEMGDYPIKAIFSDGYPQIFDVTGLGMNAGNSDPQPFCIDSYDLKGYTASGSLAYQTVFTTSYGYIATFWARTYTHVFTVPDNVTRLQVIRQATEEVKLDKQMQSSAVATLISPQPGDTLGSNAILKWNAESQDLLKEVYLSYDGGAHWQPVGLPVTGSRLALDTSFMTAGNNLSIRTVSSDGFRNSATQVDGFILEDRPPFVEVNFPQPGDVAPPGYQWDLSALMSDIDQTTGLTGVWTSSISGTIGSGASLWDITLPPGKQTLTFTASDGAGNSTTRSFEVTVAPMTEADLKIAEDNIGVFPYTGGDFWGDGTPVLEKDYLYTARLNMRGVGVPITATVALYLTPPGGSETLLVRSALGFAPFEQKSISGDFTPTTNGKYLLRAAIEAATLPDPVSGNNQCTWQLATYRLRNLYLPMIDLTY